tara:strand:- start:10414 stop:10926 length:513 start_codon:yes stop_codon:yes gene_type:complete
MQKKNQKIIFIFSLFCVPFLFLISPKWIALQGVSPCWPVLWLLPWSLNKGKAFGLFAGFCLGFFLDGLTIDGPSQIPSLMILGWWWGQIGHQGKSIELSLNLGLLSLIGTVFFGSSIWLQNFFSEDFLDSSWFHIWSFHTLLSQAILTSLIAPVLCSWILLKINSRRQPN